MRSRSQRSVLSHIKAGVGNLYGCNSDILIN